MKKGYLFLLVFLFSFGAKAQEQTLVLSEHYCDSMSYYYGDAIIRYYSAYNDDSLQLIMNEWEQICGLTEPLLSFKLLYTIGNGTFSEEMYGKRMPAVLLEYRENARGHEDMPNVPGDYYAYLRDVAANLQKLDLSPVEKVIADYYESGDKDILDNMDSTSLGNTWLYKSYAAYKEKIFRTYGRFSMGVLLGAWIPDGNIQALGNHPQIGLQIGSSWEKFSLNLELALRFMNAPKNFQVYHQGFTYDTKYHTGIYLGLGTGFTYARLGSHQLDLLAGAGYDNISVLESTSEDANDGKALSSININGGLAYIFHISKKQYIGLVGKYNLLFYKNRGGTNLSGNAITISLIYGFH